VCTYGVDAAYGNAITWNAANQIPDGAALLLNSATADSKITLSGTLNLGTDAAKMYLREIYVDNNTDSTTDYAEISGQIISDNAGSPTYTYHLVKTGAGTLSLANANNNYSGATYVKEGTLLVNGKLAAPALAQQGGPAKAFTREEIEAIIREYIVKNPEILHEVSAELEKRAATAQLEKSRAAVAQYSDAIFNSPRHVVVGNAKGDVTFVEFFDYNCGFCKRGLNDIRQLVETDKNLRVILKDLPILSEGSKEAAAIAYALKKQVKPETYWKFHLALMGQQGRIGRAEALGVAKDVGADMKRLEADLAKPGFEDAVEETKMIAGALGINGTPSYVVAEDIVVGARGYEALATRIANYRKCRRADC
jgi:autotransporter-associated beta strand protein